MDVIKNSFVYQALPDDDTQAIRVLKVLPSIEFEDDIECELLHTSLKGANRIEYEALSYTWGDTKDLGNRGAIMLHGHEHKITQNLESGLRRLRFNDRPRILWVDAICINQSNLCERGQQVSQMHQIYSPGGASRVLVWLVEQGDAKLALDECSLVESKGLSASRAHTTILAEHTFLKVCDEALNLLKQLRPNDEDYQNRLRHCRGALLFLSTYNIITVVAYPGMLEAWMKNIRALGQIPQFEELTSELEFKLSQSLTSLIDAFKAFLEFYYSCQNLFYRKAWWSRAWIVQEVVHGGDVSVYKGGLDPTNFETLYTYKMVFDIIVQKMSQQVSASSKEGALAMFQARERERIDLVNHMNVLASRSCKTRPCISRRRKDLMLAFRQQQATDERDNIYAYLALIRHHTGTLKPDYTISITRLYLMISRRIFSTGLTNLLYVESDSRELRTGEYLPSWAIDFRFTQGPWALLKATHEGYFKADKGFPSQASQGAEEPFMDQEDFDLLLIIRGICIGTVTEVKHDDTLVTAKYTILSKTPHIDNESCQALDPVTTTGVPQSSTPFVMRNDDLDSPFLDTSWGPSKMQVDDIIIVAAGCSAPLVLRQLENGHQFIGAIWLIDSELAFDVDNEGRVTFELKDNPGFSRFMYGAGCEGKTHEDVQIYTLI